MSAFYHVLGAVAKLNASMWRYRINFLPINVLAIAIMIFAGYGTASDAIESMHNASAPVAVSVAQIHMDSRLAQNYVSITGMDFPLALYEYGDKSSSGKITTVEKSWTPLFDSTSQRFLLVQRAGKVAEGDPHLATVTGMLRPMEPDVRTSLAAQNDTIQGIPVETRYMLVDGAHPANSLNSALISIVLFAGVALFLLASVNRNTIFHRADFGTPASVPQVKDVDSLNVKATGTYAFEQSGKVVEKRFVDMPSVLAFLDDGNPALFSNIDASSRFMGVTTSKRSGIWSLAIAAGSVRDAQAGYLYWGTKRRPAYRFSYTTTGGAKRQAIVTAQDVATLGTAVAMLATKPASRGSAATAAAS